MRVRKSRSEWATIIRAFERSGGPHEEFCGKRGLNLGSFRRWLYRLRKTEDATPEVALVPVTLAQVPREPGELAGRPAMEVVVAVADVQVRVVPGTDIAYVASLVAELRGRC